MNKPLLLDLYCGAGGAAKGYQRAGFYVVGVDNKPQPHYCGDAFYLGDALEASIYGFDAIHASPPCQRYSNMTKKWNRQAEHPDLIEPTRQLLIESGVPYVLENVIGAELVNPLMLCGTMFGLGSNPYYKCECGCKFEYELGKYGCPNCCGDYTAHYEYEYTLRRHRLFECSFGTILPPASCNHSDKALPVYGHAGGSSKRDGLKFPGVKSWREGMQITWMNQKELSEAIPPAFTEYIGKYLMEAVKNNIG